MDLRTVFNFIPEVKKPVEKKLSFNVKLKWTLIVLVAFFVLANIPLFGLSNNALEKFKYLAIILGTDFGSIISLGIGPIVMASIILQLLVGAKILSIDTTTAEGKKFFQGLQKILVFFFIIFEAMVYVLMQGLQAVPGLAPLLIFQLILGGLAIFYMDDVMSKWGFGSGVSLFIGAGVGWRLVTAAIQFVNQEGKNCLLDFGGTACTGKVFVLIQSIINRAPTEALNAFIALLITVLIFLAVVWAQSLKVEIPLSFGKVRGYNIKWPLAFFYVSVIPVILTAALIANIQLFGGMLQNSAEPCYNAVISATQNSDINETINNSSASNLNLECSGKAKFSYYITKVLGKFDNGVPVCDKTSCGLAFWMHSTDLVTLVIRKAFTPLYLLQGLTHILFYVMLSILFAVFWVKTSGMDAKSQAHNISASGLQVSGFRQDERVLEAILERYIIPLTIMGGAAIGLLASVTNLLGAIVSGTSILLVIMIMYQFYQNIAHQHSMDMHPAMRKFMGSS